MEFLDNKLICYCWSILFCVLCVLYAYRNDDDFSACDRKLMTSAYSLEMHVQTNGFCRNVVSACKYSTVSACTEWDFEGCVSRFSEFGLISLQNDDVLLRKYIRFIWNETKSNCIEVNLPTFGLNRFILIQYSRIQQKIAYWPSCLRCIQPYVYCIRFIHLMMDREYIMTMAYVQNGGGGGMAWWQLNHNVHIIIRIFHVYTVTVITGRIYAVCREGEY